ncbi:hypothetical protein GUA87_17660 [Sneathiella sp. P13V-1]|uniref:hypothetical protein n=1 Tax=Sneathiella sp. P13V-1 TaxID=2697366 RepID=UPI00187B9468|nr:hypothetical protein [Sneathiella sp. P13V-1]MBE7638687.1 hypothetical protein [Sneathiella sp. P13V-1]
MHFIAFSSTNTDFFEKVSNFDEKIGVCSEDTRDAVQNSNVDIAILDDNSYRVLRKERFYRHLVEFYLPLDIGVGRLFKAFLYSLRYLVRARIRPNSIVTMETTDGIKRRFLRVKVYSNKKRLGEFDYYPSDWTPMDFLRFIDDMGVNYVALRWHDKIIYDKPMKDLDILIADEDVAKITESLSGMVGRKMLHMHSVGGNETVKADQMAYFPPKISRQILKNRQPLTSEGGFKPSDEDYFLSLSYHAVVDKGAASGLPVNAEGDVDPENRFYQVLAPLKEKLGLDVDLNLEDLATYLEEENWLPPSDRIAKFSINNDWLKERVKRKATRTRSIKGDYTAILLRDIVKEWGLIETMKEDLQKMGFKILFEKELSDTDREHASTEIRGGNWTAGADWGAGAGKPYYMFLVHDPKPLKMSRKQMRQQPFVENARVLKKYSWRAKINSRFPKEQRANFVHTSDNTHETYEYLSVLAPEALDLMK